MSTAQTVERQATFTTAKTITLGDLHDTATARACCKENNIVPVCGGDILDRMKYETAVYTVGLVFVTQDDLGITEPISEPPIAVAESQGLLRCVPEVGPQLWLQHPDLPAYEMYLGPTSLLILAMDPIDVSVPSTDDRWPKAENMIFSYQKVLFEGPTKYLDAVPAKYFLSEHWPRDTRWVFMEKRKSK